MRIPIEVGSRADELDDADRDDETSEALDVTVSSRSSMKSCDRLRRAEGIVVSITGDSDGFVSPLPVRLGCSRLC